MDLIKIIDLPALRVEELNSLITEIAPKYRNLMTDEVVLMTHISDPSTSIKNPTVCIEKNKELKKKYFLNGNPFS
jgi:hypothetical protein